MSEPMETGGVGKNPAIDKINNLNAVQNRANAVLELERRTFQTEQPRAKEILQKRRKLMEDFQINFKRKGEQKMEVFCTKESSGCIQESILFATLEMDTIGLQMKFPEGFYRMEDGKRHRYYPWKGRPDMVWENHEGVQVTGQAAGQKVKISEIVPAAEAARKMTENIFPQYRFSPVYLCETGELPIGWFRMQMQDRGMEHIKAFTVIDHEMIMLTFTYPDAEAIKWKSIILSSFGTWREFHGAD